MGYMTDERRMIQETARAFALKEVLPVANKLDPEKGDIPRELIQKLADMGYFGIVIPEEYGGLGSVDSKDSHFRRSMIQGCLWEAYFECDGSAGVER